MSEPKARIGFRWTTLLRPRWVICIFLAVLALLRLAVEFIPTRIEIGPETTVIEGPLRSDGTVDYAAVLDEQWRAGVRPEENAVVDLVKAFGPDRFWESNQAEHLGASGINAAAIAGSFFVTDFDFQAIQGIVDSSARDQKFQEFDLARKRPWTAEKSPFLAEWLKTNQNPLKHIMAASTQSSYYLPVIAAPDDHHLYSVDLINVASNRDAARLLNVASMHALGNGKVMRSFDYSLACHKLARLVAQSPTLISATVSLAIDAQAVNCDAAIVLSGRLTPSQAAECRESVKQLQEFQSIVNVLDHCERWSALDLIQAAYMGNGKYVDEIIKKVPAPGSFDPNPVLREINRVMDAQIAALKLPDRTMRNKALRAAKRPKGGSYRFESQHLHLAKVLGNRRLVGQHFAERVPAMVLPSADNLIMYLDRRATSIRLTDTLYAIAEYQARHGHFPDTLAALVPSVLSELPVDPYSNSSSPLRYERRGDEFVLYSIGQNERDDAGDHGADIVVGAVTSEEE